MKTFLLSVCGLLFLYGCSPPDNMPEKAPESQSPTMQQTQKSFENDKETLQIDKFPKSKNLKFTQENFPRIDGSTSNQPLRQLLACALLGIECQWTSIDTAPFSDAKERFIIPSFIPEKEDIYYWFNSGNLEMAEEQLNQFATQEQNIIQFWKDALPNSKTHGAWVRLIEGETDLIFTATKPSDDEMQLAQANDVEFETKPIALDAFVFMTHAENPAQTLTQDQIRKIYSGALEDWKDVGVDSGESILALARNRNSGSQEAMEKLVMKDLPMSDDLQPMEMPTMMGTINRVAEETNSLCYTFYFYQKYIIPNPRIKLLAIDGAEPNTKNIASGAYPFTTQVYVTIRKNEPKDSEASQFFQWLDTPEAQKIIEASGYVPKP